MVHSSRFLSFMSIILVTAVASGYGWQVETIYARSQSTPQLIPPSRPDLAHCRHPLAHTSGQQPMGQRSTKRTLSSSKALATLLAVGSPLRRSSLAPWPTLLPGLAVRNGLGLHSTPVMSATLLKDYSAAASALFGNMRVPAALIAGSVIPLGFATVPKFEETDSVTMRLLKVLQVLLAASTLTSEMTTIVWTTVSINKLTEVVAAPTCGVMELMERDYKVQWLGANVHFFLGLFSLIATCGVNTFIKFGAKLGLAAMMGSAATVTFMVSIVNDAISQGDGVLHYFGKNFLTLVQQYVQLVFARAARGHTLLGLSGACGIVAIVAALRLVLKDVLILEKPQTDQTCSLESSAEGYYNPGAAADQSEST